MKILTNKLKTKIMKYILEANLNDNGSVKKAEYGGFVEGVIKNENGKILGGCLSTTLDWLEHDLLSKVNFDKEKDTYTRNW